MDNLENKNVDVQNTAPAAESSSLPTYDAINASSETAAVTPDVIAERLRAAGGTAAPLAGKRDEARRRRDEGASADAGKKGERPQRPKRERRGNERPTFAPRGPVSSIPTPNRREALSGDLADEFAALMGDASIDSLMSSVDDSAAATQLEEGAKVQGRVASVSGDSVFVDLGARELGLVPLKQFPDDFVLEPGQQIEVVVTKFDAAEGVYDVALPLAAAEVGDWLSLTKGAIVEVVVTAANTGGLECQVGKLRGFLPFSQIDVFRVENPERFVGERWKCVVTECNPERRNLVVSRRALIEQEREELREKTLSELAEGQTREGLVRKIIDVGVFVDLGGVDGFIPVSEISWTRVKHPSEVVKEGERVVVTITRIDPANNRISLSLKDKALDPWNKVDEAVHVGEVLRGRVSKIADFGAFVDLGEGIEGLVHVSEIAYQRVKAVSDALQVGDWVDVKVLDVDQEKRRVSLSIKKTMEDPRVKAKREAAAKADADAAAAEAEERRKDDEALAASREKIRKLQSKKPLKGGLNRGDDGGTGLRF
ncbi:MAG: 30S ribosomal protein S1 [Thermoguttaceae bacterium]